VELTREVQQKAMSEIKEAFNRLPVGTARATLDAAIETVLDRHYGIHQQQEREKKEAARRDAEQQQKRRDAEYRASLYLSHIDKYLQEEFEFDGGYYEMRKEATRLREPIREALVEDLMDDPQMAADGIRARIEQLVDEELG
jgi:hypothetical protein